MWTFQQSKELFFYLNKYRQAGLIISNINYDCGCVVCSSVEPLVPKLRSFVNVLERKYRRCHHNVHQLSLIIVPPTVISSS